MKLSSALAAAALALPGMAFAGPNYNFVELSYGTGEYDFSVSGLGSADIDQDGFKLEGSIAATENLLLRGSFAALDGDESGIDLETDTIVLGASWIFPINEQTGIDAGLEYRTDDLTLKDSSSSISDDASGAGISVGITSAATDNLNLSARLSYLGSDYDGAYTLDLSGTYFINDRVGISLGLERLDADDDGVSLELNQVQLGIRARF